MRIKRIVLSLIQMVVVLWILSTITFILMKLTPGDPVNAILHVGESNVSQTTINETRAALGLNQSIFQQYIEWLSHIIRLDFGTSYQTGNPVTEEIVFYAPPTLIIAGLTIVVVMCVALPLGVLAAFHYQKPLDRVIRIVTSMTVSIPSFFLGIILIYVFATRLNILPASGLGTPFHFVLPVIAMSVGMSAYYVRLMRSTVIDLYQSREVEASRLRGMSERYIFFYDVLKPSLVPIVTILGLSIGSLIGGTVVIENLFGIPGIGQFLVDSIRARDYPVIQGVVLMIGLFVMIANFVSDVIVLWLDPIQRYHKARHIKRHQHTVDREVTL
ncbi:nickel ABC transporter permease [Staphylococcus canis]|uniref:Nickel import system permease protein NikB n=1 Tax=Staphylococcus canis TaxID=2724942 RepID=A0ABS0T6R9_9STAP|nr:nickel ABC transporter permease [Staphylococcus canis]MBI5974444.1 ABC transporter permease [Staphylococcus canis]